MKYLLDSNICIYLIKQQPSSVLQRFEKHFVGDIGISSITVAELAYGVEKSQHVERNQKALEQFLLSLNIVSFDKAAAFAYGNIRADLQRTGQLIGPLDMLIAAQALSLRVVLVTNNEREFVCVPKLRIENWIG
jgi:tRNA(fMet)-specific endonuclease VapC